MRKLICRCPETQQPVDPELYTDYATLARIWSNSLRFQCPHCGAEHETNVEAAWLEEDARRANAAHGPHKCSALFNITAWGSPPARLTDQP
jgi:hypothetical protein